MFSTSKVFLGVASLIGAGGLGLFGAHEATKKTISHGLKERKIPQLKDGGLSGNVWGIMTDRFLDNAEDIELKSKQFIDFKNMKEENLYQPEELENFCKGKLDETYSTIFTTDEKLLDDVKRFCTINIENLPRVNLLEASETERDKNQETFKKRLSTLKNSRENLVDTLSEVKKSVSKKDLNEENDWKELAKWCDISYKLSFVDVNDLLWKNVETYCSKPKAQEVH